MNNYLKEILLSIDIGNDEFFTFLEGKIHRYPLDVHEFPWATFPKCDSLGTIYDIRIVAPVIKDIKTLLVNVHEISHAWEYFGHINEIYFEDEESSENYAKAKELECLNLIKIHQNER